MDHYVITVVHCDNSVENCDITVEHCDSTVEHFEITVVHCDTTLEHSHHSGACYTTL